MVYIVKCTLLQGCLVLTHAQYEPDVSLCVICGVRVTLILL